MKKISLITAFALASSSLGAASLEDAIKGVKIEGNSYIRYISNSGENDGGRGYAMRLVTEITTGSISNFSFNAGLFYQYGGTPAQGSTSDNATNGSRGDRTGAKLGSGNTFGISTLWAKYAFDGIDTDVVFGKTKLSTPISSSSTDRGVGVLATSKPADEISLTLGFYDSWVADNQFIGGIFTNTGSAIQAHDIGNNLALFGVNGDYDNASFKLWYFNVANFMNSVFGEFSIGDEYEFKAQVAYTDIYNNPSLKTKAILENGTNNTFDPKTSAATSRGLYTLQFAMKPIDSLSAKVGYVGSFGDGYGVALNNTASFSYAGKWWFDNFGNGRNGFAYSGQGGLKDTHINLWYIALAGKASIVDLGLDIVGISGKNQFAVSKYIDEAGTNVGTNSGNRTFFEITPSVDINIAKGAKLSAYYAFVFGQINAQRFWTQVSYKF